MNYAEHLESTTEAVTVINRQDKRAVWDNSPDLRESVRDDLYEWGGAMRGGFPDLGYPRQQPFARVPSKSPPTYDVDKVQAITDTFVLWNLAEREMADEMNRRLFNRMQKALKLYFIGQGPAESAAKIMKVSRRTYYRILGDAMYRFWVLHY